MNLDAIFNGNNTFRVGQGSTGYDQITVLQQWFEFLSEETCDLFGRFHILSIPSFKPLARLSNFQSKKQFSDAWLGLRENF